MINLFKLYNRLKKFLKRSKEIDLWPSIDYHYMTDESEGEGDYMIQHHLPCRSSG